RRFDPAPGVFFVFITENICNIARDGVVSPPGGAADGLVPRFAACKQGFLADHEESDHGDGRADPPCAALPVSVLTSDLPIDQGPDRPVRRRAHATRVPP